MLFNSIQFIAVFLPISLLAFNLSERRYGRLPAIGVMIVASLIFYASWYPPYLLILLASICGNCLLGNLIERHERHFTRVLLLALAVSGNLLLLFYFKYFLYVVALIGVDIEEPESWLFSSHFLPLGISFWTFQQINFLVERYNRRQDMPNFLNYFSIVSYFPHLIAGPIVRVSELGPQMVAIGSRDRDCWRDAAVGLSLFVFGLAKKCLIADRISVIPDAVFGGKIELSIWSSWLAAISYMLQLYFDFSGYCDMGMGLARMYGFNFPINFNSPLKARSFVEFWRTWHITLTRFFTDTLYLPLAMLLMRRFGHHYLPILQHLMTVSVPVFVIFLLTGIWHGAGNQFLVFGVLNGLFMAIGVSVPDRWGVVLPSWISNLLTFLLVSAVFIFFRAGNLGDAIAICRHLVWIPNSGDLNHLGAWLGNEKSAAVMIGVAVLIALYAPNLYEFFADVHQPIGFKPGVKIPAVVRFRPNLFWGGLTGLLFAWCMLELLKGQETPFLYFQF